MTGYRIGRIFGIEIHIHSSWLIIGALILWTFAARVLPLDFPDMAPALRFAMATATTLLFFLSLLAHELAHSVVAMVRGIPVRRITFFLFGGMAQTSTDSRSAGEEFIIAIAGPVMSFLLAGLFFALWTPGAGPGAGEEGGPIGWGLAVTGVAFYMMYLNILLGAFNLLPGFPMDGGRVLRAVIWKATGSVTRATKWASRVGSGMALLLMGYGLWEAVSGRFISGMWLVLIGMFIRNAARASYRHHLVSRMQDMTRKAWEGHRYHPFHGRPSPGGGPGHGGGPAPGRGGGAGGGAPQGPPRGPDWPPRGRDVTGLSGDG